jgi:tetratricopeptide (TPR) repeat protein
MFRTSSRYFLSLLLFCLLGPSLLAQRSGMGGTRPPGGIIDVQVRYADGRPAPRGIHIRLESAEGGSEADLETIDGGKCQFRQSTSGVFMVRISEGAYKEVSARVELISSPRAFVTLDLVPLKKEENSQVISVPPAGSDDSVSVKSLAIPEQARQEFDKGEEALKANQPEESAKHFEKATKLYGNYPEAYRMLGEAYLQSHDLKNAESALKKSVELEPKIAATYVDLGAVQNQLKNYSGAETSLKQGLELSPDAAAAKYELAKTYWALGRWQDAAPFAQDAVTALPTLASARVLLGNILLKQRNAAGALEQYQEYLRLEPNGSMAPAVQDLVGKIQKALQK